MTRKFVPFWLVGPVSTRINWTLLEGSYKNAKAQTPAIACCPRMRGTSAALSFCQIWIAMNASTSPPNRAQSAITLGESQARVTPDHCVARRKHTRLARMTKVPGRSSCRKISFHDAATGFAELGGLKSSSIRPRAMPPIGRLMKKLAYT